MSVLTLDSAPGRALFRQINHYANRHPDDDFVADHVQWNEPDRPFEAEDDYLAYWGEAADYFFREWQSERFYLEVWMAARAIYAVTHGHREFEVPKDASQCDRARIAFLRLMDFLASTSDIPSSSYQMKLVHRSIDTGDKIAQVFPSRYTDKDSTIRCSVVLETNRVILESDGDEVPHTAGWLRRTIEVGALHEFRHFLVNCFRRSLPRCVHTDEECNHSDSPYEIDARLFAALAFDVFIQLVPVLELRGQDLFPCYFGNFSVSSLADAANEVEALKSAVACLSHTEKPKGVNPFRERFAAPRLESVAKSDLCGRMELFRMKLRLDVGASSSDELEKCFMSLAQAMQSDSNLAMRAQAVEFQGYAARRLSELSSTTGSTLATKHYSELAIDIFQTRLIESGSPRFCKYMLFEAHIHGQLTSQGFWRLWQQLSESFLSCWEAQYGDAVTAALSKLTLNEAEQIEVEGLFRDLGRIPYVVTVMTLHSRSVKPSFVEFCDSYFKRIEAKLSRFYRRIVTPGISQGLSGSFGFAKECHQQFILLDWVRSAIANVGADVCNDEDLQTTGGFANLEILGLINVMTVFESELPLLTDQLKPMPANLGMLYFLIPELQSKLVEEFDRIVWPESRAADWIREFRAHLGEGEVS